MTALRDIVVVLDGSARSEIRLDIAVALAQQHDAHLTGLSALTLLMPPRAVVPPHSNPEMATQARLPIADLGCCAAPPSLSGSGQGGGRKGRADRGCI